MAALDFPAGPTVGQVFNSWTYDGVKWDLTGGATAFSGYTFVQDTQPTGSILGQTWFDTSVGLSFVWFDGFWVQSSPGGGGGTVPVVEAFHRRSWITGAAVPAANTEVRFVPGSNVTQTSIALIGSDGIITAPRTGFYHIDAWVSFGAGVSSIGLYLRKVSQTGSAWNYASNTSEGHANGYGNCAISATVYLLAGETVHVLVSVEGTAFAWNATSGYAPAISVTMFGNAEASSQTITPWTAVTFQNSWVNYGLGAGSDVQYRKVGDEVQLRGLMKSGLTGGFTAFALPVGFRPPATLQFPCDSNAAFAHLDVNANGNVVAGNGSNVWWSLANVRFSVTP